MNTDSGITNISVLIEKMFFPGLVRTLIFLSVLILVDAGKVFAVVPIFKNDLAPDQPGSVIEITEVKGVSLSRLPRILVYPGDEKRIALRSVYQFTVSRIYPNKKELFMIECPRDDRQRRQAVFTYSVLLSGQLPGDCIILRRGSWSQDKGREWNYVGASQQLLTK
jgi:hypothetical protein